MLKHVILAISVVTALSTPAQSQAQQVLRVGTNEIGSPWSFHDAASHSERGIAVEIHAEIGKDTGYSIQLVPMPTIVGLIPALTLKQNRRYRSQHACVAGAASVD